ncbi:MAG: DUF692 domain-containing protein [Hahellaceae bacterium]|nr:DUF692 domain-containing protein [Hahellaceae bacterium]
MCQKARVPSWWVARLSRRVAPAEGGRVLGGVGIGLRSVHYRPLLACTSPPVAWLEVLIDNYLGEGGQPLAFLDAFAERYPLSFHGVGLSLGSADPLDMRYLTRLRERIRRYSPLLVSEHLSWGRLGARNSHELLPLPFTPTVARYLADRIQAVQTFLGCRLLIENLSSYLTYADDVMAEWEFLCEVVQQADCDVLCDLNNIYVSACNHDFDPQRYLEALPRGRVKEIHLAGFSDEGSHLLDTHSAPVSEPVWMLYRSALKRFGAVPTLIEWDNDIPALPVLLAEVDTARRVWEDALHAGKS